MSDPRRWLVQSGEIHEIVEAADAEEAMAKVFTLFDEDDSPPVASNVISAIEVIGEELWWPTGNAIKRAGRWASDYDGNAAIEKAEPTT